MTLSLGRFLWVFFYYTGYCARRVLNVKARWQPLLGRFRVGGDVRWAVRGVVGRLTTVITRVELSNV